MDLDLANQLEQMLDELEIQLAVNKVRGRGKNEEVRKKDELGYGYPYKSIQ